MSTLTVSNVSDGSLSVPTTYVTNGSAKAWVNLNGTGTIAARDSFNVASLTDNGTGNYTINYTTSMASGNYATSGSIDTGVETSASPARAPIFNPRLAASVTTAGTASTGAAVDWDFYTVSVDGDLA
jgi:hypothetical protein